MTTNSLILKKKSIKIHFLFYSVLGKLNNFCSKELWRKHMRSLLLISALSLFSFSTFAFPDNTCGGYCSISGGGNYTCTEQSSGSWSCIPNGPEAAPFSEAPSSSIINKDVKKSKSTEKRSGKRRAR